MPTISTKEYLLDQAKRRFTPSITNFPGMSMVEKRLLTHDWPQHAMAEPPAGSALKPVMGDAGLPIVGHMIEMFRGGPDYIHFLYKTRGPVLFADSPVLPAVTALGPDAAQIIYSNRNKDYSQQGWVPVIGPFFYDYTVFVGGENFTVTEPNDIKFLDYFYQRCIAADELAWAPRARRPGLISRIFRWMAQPI